MNEWQTMESAPTDRQILLYRPSAYKWAKVNFGQFEPDLYSKKPQPYWTIWYKLGSPQQSREWEPTHWMDIPKPPNDGDV
jgi:hypothetical protein